MRSRFEEEHGNHCSHSPTGEHCFHTPRYWMSVGPAPKICCWCGRHKQPDHGPYSSGHGNYRNLLDNFEKIRKSQISYDEEWVDTFKT